MSLTALFACHSGTATDNQSLVRRTGGVLPTVLTDPCKKCFTDAMGCRCEISRVDRLGAVDEWPLLERKAEQLQQCEFVKEDQRCWLSAQICLVSA
jgi:hypothetical protein